MKLIGLDVETGGLDPVVNSLLSVAVAVWEDGEITDSLHVTIKQENYNVTSHALRINKLNILEVYDNGVTKEEACKLINNFIKRNCPNEKVSFCGQNVAFDVAYLKQLYKDCKMDYYENISHRSVDTASIFNICNKAELFGDVSVLGLDDAIDYFKLDKTNRHDALKDITNTLHAAGKIVNLIKK